MDKSIFIRADELAVELDVSKALAYKMINQQNEELKAKICDSMESGVRYQVKELAKLVGMESFQKCSALVKQLKDCGKVARSEEKGVAYFTKVE